MTTLRWVRQVRLALRRRWLQGAPLADRARAAPPRLEALEDRNLLSVSPFYSIDGTGNNLAHPDWGSVGVDLLRMAPAQYGDGISSLGGVNRPSARLISDVLVSDPTDGGLPNNRFMSDMVYAWGQFIDHDMDLTTNGTGTQFESANITVPNDPNDPFSTAATPPGPGMIFFNRSEFDPNTGTSKSNPRQQPNDITAFLDASMIYGSDPVVADALRTHSGGLLKSSPGPDGKFGTQDDLLPYNNQTYFPGFHEVGGDGTGAFHIANDAHIVHDSDLFMAGDIRANENIELTSLHTLFMREHNRIAGIISHAAPFLKDETVFQLTRAIVIGEVQSITFNEFLPALLGNGVISAYGGYNPRVNPGIATEFSTAAFRLGHSLLAPDVEFLNPDGSTKFGEVSLADSFFNPPLINARGVDPILKYLATDNAQEIDNKIVPELQNFLFGPPGAGGFDLASLNIQRGRDHGLADYNTTRAAYGLRPVTSFAQITSNTDVQAKLEQLYGDVNNIDLWVGALAEDHVAGGSVGPLIQRIVVNQFSSLRSGDRLWFENLYAGPALTALENTTLAQLISRNTVNNDLQANVFFFKMQITGTVFNDANGNGVRDFGEGGVSGRVIQVLDPSGNVVGQTTTDANGRFSFDNLSAGLEPAVAYRVVEVLPQGVVQTTPDPQPITFSRGETFSHVDFGNAKQKSSSTASSTRSSTKSSSVASDSGTTSGGLDASAILSIARVLDPAL
ncbi:MAG TPA: peroxidase family protein [Gemmataceae bacterium]|nr:peroxidase family protein [Gemmataceae bacterium]